MVRIRDYVLLCPTVNPNAQFVQKCMEMPKRQLLSKGIKIMLKLLMWDLIFFALRIVWSISKDFVQRALREVVSVNNLRKPDGSSYTGREKYEIVFDELSQYADNYEWGTYKTSIINTVIELTVSYLKSIRS